MFTWILTFQFLEMIFKKEDQQIAKISMHFYWSQCNSKKDQASQKNIWKLFLKPGNPFKGSLSK